jgi:hypothetical protein
MVDGKEVAAKEVVFEAVRAVTAGKVVAERKVVLMGVGRLVVV